MKRFGRAAKKVVKKAKPPSISSTAKKMRTFSPKKLKKLSPKKLVKTVGKAGKKATKATFEAAIYPLGLASRVRNAIFNELSKLEDMTGIPGVRLVGGLLIGKPSISDIMQVVETYSKGARSKQFPVTQSTMKLFDDFIKDNPSFPYKKTYGKIRWYYQANNPKGAITFENRVYMKRKPSQTSLPDVSLLFHEYVHTCQYYKYGHAVFALTYTGNYLWNLARGSKKAYERIDFEKQAYTWDNKFCDWLASKRLGFTGSCRS
jgi:hypothetical protein